MMHHQSQGRGKALERLKRHVAGAGARSTTWSLASPFSRIPFVTQIYVGFVQIFETFYNESGAPTERAPVARNTRPLIPSLAPNPIPSALSYRVRRPERRLPLTPLNRPLVHYLGWLIKSRGPAIWDRFSTRLVPGGPLFGSAHKNYPIVDLRSVMREFAAMKVIAGWLCQPRAQRKMEGWVMAVRARQRRGRSSSAIPIVNTP